MTIRDGYNDMYRAHRAYSSGRLAIHAYDRQLTNLMRKHKYRVYVSAWISICNRRSYKSKSGIPTV